MKLAEIMINNGFNNERKPPEFLFYDLNLGQESMAYQYWPSYSVQVESSFPPWWYEKLIKRWEYLNKLGSLATEDMYMQCWKISKFDAPLMSGYLLQALRVLPPGKKIPVTKEILKEILEMHEKKTQGIQLDLNSFDDIREFLAKDGDEESLQYMLSKYENHKNYILDSFSRIMQEENTPQYPLIGILAKNANPELRLLPLEVIRRFPTPANRKILEQLQDDNNEQVRNAAKQVAAYLEKIKNMPIDELVDEPKGN